MIRKNVKGRDNETELVRIEKAGIESDRIGKDGT